MSTAEWQTSFAERMHRFSPRKGSAEQRIIDYIHAHPEKAAFSSASAIGKETDTSDASVIRTIQKLGYAGMRDFREELRSVTGHTEPLVPASRDDNRGGERKRGMSARALYTELREMIVTGSLGLETHVTESQLAGIFGVSRTPVREAVRMLEQSGIVVRDHRGITTPRQTKTQVNELYDAHILLHSALAKRAAERRTDADLHTMRSMNEIMRRMPLDQAGSVEAKIANSRFHESVYDAARDRTLGTLLRQLTDRLDVWSGTTLDAPGRWIESLDEHDALVDAIEARDADSAIAIITQHLETARRIRLSLI